MRFLFRGIKTLALIKGAPTNGQIQLLLDSQSSVVKAGWTALQAIQAINSAKVSAMLGDGTTANPGLGNSDWAGRIASSLTTQSTFFRPDKLYKRMVTGLGGFMASFDTQIKAYLPAGLSYTSGTVAHAFDAFLTRQNGLWGGTSGIPAPCAVTSGWTLTPTTGGSIPNVASGSAPRVCVTFVGASDNLESPASAVSEQVALTGSNSAYQIGATVLGTTVPSGVYKIGVYRQAIGGTGAYTLDQYAPVTAGVAFPVITLSNSDVSLRSDWQPPVWASCLLLPEAAALFALAYATTAQSGNDAQPVYAANGMISPGNVAAGRADSFLGIGNTPATTTFLTVTPTGDTAATSSGGTLQTSNSSGQSIQGFAGSLGIQARITSALSGAATVTVVIHYYNSVTGLTTSQMGTLSATFSSAAVGSLATFTVPPDSNGNPLLVTGVTFNAISGAVGAGGSFVIEPVSVRAY